MIWKNKMFLATVIVLMLIAGSLIYSVYVKSDKGPTKNLGVSHMTINGVIDDSGITTESTEIDSVVPTYDELVRNLTNSDYMITSSDTLDDFNSPVKRVFAKKGKSFIDICYDVSEADYDAVFKNYESKYTKYYILAQNTSYVYCISDKKTFQKAGFQSLANVGVQYIYE